MTKHLIPGLNVDNTNKHWLLRIALQRRLISIDQCPESLKTENISTLEAWMFLESLDVSQQKILEVILSQYELEEADFSKLDPDAAPFLDSKTCRKYNVVPLYGDNHSLSVATVDPFDDQTDLFLRFTSGRFIKFFITTPEKIANYFNTESDDAIINLVSQLAETDSQNPSQPSALNDDEALPFVIRLVNTIIIRAVTERVSDIHILHNTDGCKVRFRIDGVLREEANIPEQIAENVMSRLKVMAGIDSSANQKPTDGRAKLYAGGRLVDLRFNFVPTVDGRKATIRLQDSRQRKELANIGYSEFELSQFKRLISAKVGLILVTGPTGSGKTNTLYAALDYIRDPSKNIISIEDPVEFMDKDITQIQVNNKTGFTFSVGLRAAMRQDPDIILVGEIRDKETAETALQASETGHLVLSTLHSRSAVGTLLRLLELGINKGLLANSIAGVVAQRLLRKLCRYCAKPVAVESINLPDRIKALISAPPKIHNVSGCSHCHQSGYSGRIAIAEIMTFSTEIRQAVSESKPLHEIESIARSQGMQSLEESAFQHYFSGETTLEEIARVLDIEDLDYSKEQVHSVVTAENHKNTKSVLLVYSDEKAAQLVKQNLSNYSFSVTVVADDLQVEDFINKEQLFDLVICELNTANINAGRLTSKLRSDIKYAAIPILIINEPNQQDETRKVIELGANDYMTKPISFNLLLKRILAVLNRTSL